MPPPAAGDRRLLGVRVIVRVTIDIVVDDDSNEHLVVDEVSEALRDVPLCYEFRSIEIDPEGEDE